MVPLPVPLAELGAALRSCCRLRQMSLRTEEAYLHWLRRFCVFHGCRHPMGMGESEITAQVKQAYLAAHAQGATGPVLNRLFQKSLHAAKVIRSRTGIAGGQASIGSVVVRVVRDVFGGDVQDCEVLLWGAGKAT